MNLRTLPLLAAAAAFLVPVLASEVASAQPVYVVAVPVDGPRFRGGIALEGGPFLAPTPAGMLSVGGIGVRSEIGVQINNLVGVYAVPRLDIVGGHGLVGVAVGGGVLGEFTFPGIPLSLGAGPEVGAIEVFSGAVTSNGTTTVTTAAAIAGAFYGATVHVGFHPIVVRTGIRRRALTIGADVHFLYGDYAAGGVNTTGVTLASSVGHIAISPLFYIGYTAF